MNRIKQKKSNGHNKTYMQIMNKFTIELGNKYCPDGQIDWNAIVKLNSEIKIKSTITLK